MFGMTPPKKPMKRTTPETMTVSQCCESSVYASTPDDYNKVDIKDTDSLIMSIEYICNKCGKVCLVKEMPLDEIYRRERSILTPEIMEQYDS